MGGGGGGGGAERKLLPKNSFFPPPKAIFMHICIEGPDWLSTGTLDAVIDNLKNGDYHCNFIFDNVQMYTNSFVSWERRHAPTAVPWPFFLPLQKCRLGG